VQALPWIRQTSQVQVPPEQVVPEAVSAQVRPEQQPAWSAQLDPTPAQVWQVPASQVNPTQQSAVPAQDWVAALQESQMQASPPAQRVPSMPTQESAGLWVQQSAVAVQLCSCDWQVGGTAHLPARHCSEGALQQSALATQLPPVGAQVLADWQVPPVAPGGMTQPRPAQQSALAVHEPPVVAQGAAQVPLRHWLEQQSLAWVQAPPFDVQAPGTSQVKAPVPAWKVQTVPAQQLPSSAPWQDAWRAVQEGTVQRRTPAWSGTQGAKLQHWSRNWQTPPLLPVPAGMQQLGSLAS
jgi:hypothetical protein